MSRELNKINGDISVRNREASRKGIGYRKEIKARSSRNWDTTCLKIQISNAIQQSLDFSPYKVSSWILKSKRRQGIIDPALSQPRISNHVFPFLHANFSGHFYHISFKIS
jgi:hypothetical protein